MQEILGEHAQNKNYGAPRMQHALAQRGMNAGLRRVKRIMREHGWLHERRRRPKGLTKADPAAMASENLDILAAVEDALLLQEARMRM